MRYLPWNLYNYESDAPSWHSFYQLELQHSIELVPAFRIKIHPLHRWQTPHRNEMSICHRHVRNSATAHDRCHPYFSTLFCGILSRGKQNSRRSIACVKTQNSRLCARCQKHYTIQSQWHYTIERTLMALVMRHFFTIILSHFTLNELWCFGSRFFFSSIHSIFVCLSVCVSKWGPLPVYLPTVLT